MGGRILTQCIIITILALDTVSVTAQMAVAPEPTAQPIPRNYHLVWSDEFDKDGPPDPGKWTYENGFVRNQEFQWYQPGNAVCKNGFLIIEARRTHQPNPNYDSTSSDWRKNRRFIEYTSACLKTAGRGIWKYGLFEMRGRIDVNPGCWPAWWTLGTEKRWPANGEIDIMEYYRNKLLANIACMGPDQKPQWSSKTMRIDEHVSVNGESSVSGESSVNGESSVSDQARAGGKPSIDGQTWADRFHIWRMYWNEDSIVLTVDGTTLNKVNTNDFIDKDGSNFEPFKTPEYMLLNLAIGGQNGGDPEKTSFPRRFEVDYVRVYQKMN